MPSKDPLVKTKWPGIYRRGSKWLAKISVTDERKRRQVWLTADTRRELESKIEGVRNRARSADYVPPRSDTLAVAAVLDAWLESVAASVRPVTLRGYKSNVRQVKAALGSKLVRKLTAADLTALYTSVVESGRTSYVATNLHAVVRDALALAVRQRKIRANVARDAVLPRRSFREMVTLTEESAAYLLDAAEDDMRVLIAFTLATGLRRSEVLGLQWRDVDLDAAEIHVRRGLHVVEKRVVVEPPKSAQSRRDVALPPSTCVLLRTHREAMERRAGELGGQLLPDHHVFVRPDFSPKNPDTISHEFLKVKRRAIDNAAADAKRDGVLSAMVGLERLRFHDLRHASASLLLAQGVSLKVISDRLGHSDVRVTANLYLHPDRDLQREAAAALDAALAPRPSRSLGV